MTVLVTGHTGFKGGWLSLWLSRLGAEVHGYALDPSTNPNLFELTQLDSRLRSDTRANLGDLERLVRVVREVEPAVIFHLAAQPLVLDGYQDPIGTFATNIMGTANVLQAARAASKLRAITVITTDKVYDNREWPYPYREVDALGGHDPYSASKGAAEIVAASYRSSFFGDGHPAHLATARAGNVIGGGDWAANRLLPDCFRAFMEATPVSLRYPKAVRPWQHVLEPVAGYIQLAERLLGAHGEDYARAWNFGPDAGSDATVEKVAKMTCRLMGDEGRVELAASDAPHHEAGVLRLDSSLARAELGWRPRWGLTEGVARTVAWHRAWLEGRDMRAFSESQIHDYQSCDA